MSDDNDKKKINDLNELNVPVFEPGLSELISSNLNRRLYFKSDIEPGLNDCNITISCYLFCL